MISNNNCKTIVCKNVPCLRHHALHEKLSSKSNCCQPATVAAAASIAAAS